MTVKIAVVGGGSSMFVPGLVRRLIEIPCFDNAELRLMDINDRRLAVMENLATELVAAEGRKLAVTSTTDRLKALRGADFVISAISVGGMAAWANDIEVPARYGVFMHIADSIGPGGIFRAMRNTPVVAAVARDVAEVAPRTLLLNYTNPASVNAMAMAGYPRAVGFSLFLLANAVQPPVARRHGGRSARGRSRPAQSRRDQPLHRHFVLQAARRHRCDAARARFIRQRGHPVGNRHLRGRAVLLGALARVLPPAPAS